MSTTFTASTTQVNHLAEIFHALSSIGSQGLVIINSKGIIIYCEHNHILNCQTIIDISLFNSFNLVNNRPDDGNTTDISDSDDAQHSTNVNVNETSLFVGSQDPPPSQSQSQNRLFSQSQSQELRFGIDLELVNHSFEVLTHSTKDIICYISYNGEGSPFTIEFEDNIMSELIEFLTFYVDLEYPYDVPIEDQENELVINYNEVEYEMILKSDIVSNILQDLLQINTNELYIYLSNEGSNKLLFISNGPIGLLKLIYPNEKTILEKLEIYNSLESRYLSTFKFQNFIKCFKAVKLSTKCKLLRDSNGIFSIQLICKDSNSNSYSGSLITINMLELDQEVDINNVEDLFNDMEIPQVKRRRLNQQPGPLNGITNGTGVNDIEVPIFL